MLIATAVAGVSVPKELIKRFPRVKKEASKEEKKEGRKESARIGKAIAVELIEVGHRNAVVAEITQSIEI